MTEAASFTPDSPMQTLDQRQKAAIDDVPFHRRHNGPSAADVEVMLRELGCADLSELIDRTVPSDIRLSGELQLGRGADDGLSEHEALQRLRSTAGQNRVLRSLIGMGYYDTITPPVILRNILENPGWYTAYTPYQAEIAQGRLEALLNFQTMIISLTGLEIANASLLDEGTAAAEAMGLCLHAARGKKTRFLVAADCHPQTIEVVRTRAWPIDVQVEVGTVQDLELDEQVAGVLVQYPGTDGVIADASELVGRAREAGALVVVAADLLSLALLQPPGEWGADIVVGSTQRFGLPMGYGGPHAAYFATRDIFKRRLPGRVVGVSKDGRGRPALRLALQTREQHIRRDKATSNICTAQVLPAVIASMYAVYHGPAGVRQIAERVHGSTCQLAAILADLGYHIRPGAFFDTLTIELDGTDAENSLLRHAADAGFNLRSFGNGAVGISLDERATRSELETLTRVFARCAGKEAPMLDGYADAPSPLGNEHLRSSPILTEEVFRAYRSETELLRYLHRLEAKDLSLTTSMIPLGSCTMKLNATAEMIPITWPEFAGLHPFAPLDQAAGYAQLFGELEGWLAEITGFDAISLQPNAGSQGELAGLLVIKRYHEDRGEAERDVCIIPTSAHGTNPASAVMAGMKVVPVACDDNGNIDVADLERKASEHSDRLAALMVTYPSTHGVFEQAIRRICEIVHQHGGQVYMDGANMNAQVGLCRPADFGADVCHLNLHKTFCIPHGGGGPGMGPIGVQPHLAPYLPGHQIVGLGDQRSLGAISAAPWGSGTILPISWAYIAMMGNDGLRRASELAILNANYMASRLEQHFPVLYRGEQGLVAHECILDLRPLKSVGVEVDDVAKRLMDFGFHAPTVSWPVAGTIMIEPTESESKAEIDRFCDALIAIREEVKAIEEGRVQLERSALRNAPHTAEDLASESWDRDYSREQAVFPAPWTRQHKYWPPVNRIDNVYGDRNLVCSCVGMEDFVEVGE